MTHKGPGFPIRTFPDQCLLPTPRDFSQGATSFIASQCQGIHQMPFSRLLSLNLAHAGAKPALQQRRRQMTEDRCQKTDVRRQMPGVGRASAAIAMHRGMRRAQGSAKPPGRDPATRSGPAQRTGIRSQGSNRSPASGRLTTSPSPRNTLAPRRTSRTLFTMSTNKTQATECPTIVAAHSYYKTNKPRLQNQ